MSEAEQARLWNKALQRQKGCPDAEELFALLDRSSDTPLARHVESCPYCSAELDLMRQITAAETDKEEADAVQWMVGKLEERRGEIFQDAPSAEADVSAEKAWRLRDWLWSAPGWAALASAALAVIVLGGIWLNRGEMDPLVPPGGSPPVVRSGRIVQLVPSGDLSQPPKRFSWQAVEGAAAYRLQVFEVDQSEIWSGETSGSNLLLPSDLRQKVVPGKRLIWQVTAFDGQGRRLATSSQTGFRVRQ